MPEKETKQLLIKSTCVSALAGFFTTHFLLFIAGTLIHLITTSAPYQFLFSPRDRIVEIQPENRDPKQLVKALTTLAPHISAAERQEIVRSVSVAAQLFQLDPFLIFSVMEVESSFIRGAVSPRGALGLMQVMPTTGDYVKDTLLPKHFRHGSLFQIAHNIAVGSRYLSYLADRFNNNWYHALVAYNWGPTRLANTLSDGGEIPKTVQGYAARVLGNYKRMVEDFGTA